MLETAEVGHKVSKAAFAREEPKLREALVLAQFELSQRKRGPVVILVSGVEGAGRHETANQLTAWMDPRHIRVVAFAEPTPEERARPPAWRSWQALPPRGAMGIFMNAWYRELLIARIRSKDDDIRFDDALQRIRPFEEMLAAEGVLLLKFWIHLSKEAQKERLRAIQSDPKERWRIAYEDKRALRHYNRSRSVWEHILRTTSTGVAPWYVVEGADRHYRELTIAKLVLEALDKAIKVKHPPVARDTAAPAPAILANVEVIRHLDLSSKLTHKDYVKDLAKYQRRLAMLTRDRRFQDRALVLAFEGLDAAGKGGAIRRVTGALDARQYLIVPIAAPTEEERAQPYLWRFWRHVPAKGGITLFDRTWYGRVLVERVEHLCATADWMRAYDEINQFEENLVEGGIVVCKFWLQISKAEQLRRFRAREKTPFKRFKITPEDWRNRRNWTSYEQAVADMVERTSTDIVPWTIVEAEDKNFARVKVLKTICASLSRALD
jgi:AMP-polyphosphate phosphotransferase